MIFSPDLLRPCSEAGPPAWGVLFACVLSHAFFKTALLRCDSYNIQQFTHRKGTTQWLLHIRGICSHRCHQY